MTGDWREIFSRLLDEEDLSEADARLLAMALRDPPHRREAIEWLRFEAILRSRFSPTPQIIGRSKARLVERVLERETGPSDRLPSGRSRRRRISMILAAAAALAAAVLGTWWLTRDTYPRPEIRGDVRILRGGVATASGTRPRRGDTLIAGPGGASLTLGGYCRIRLDPRAEVVIAGYPQKEEIELQNGRVVSQVDPGRGRYSVRTLHGSIEVAGTEFAVALEDPKPKGETSMNPAQKSLARMLTVSVIAGTVVCHLGEKTLTLGTNESYLFAGDREEGKTHGTVVSAGEKELQIKAGNATVTLTVSAEKKLIVKEVSQLNPGDAVTATWVAEEGRKFVTRLDGRGKVVGKVTRVEAPWIEITPENGKTQKFMPKWIGGMPADGGGHDKKVLTAIREQKVGSVVEITWVIEEGKRVVDIKPVH
ncbi:MAG: FecR domain-containing protein [Planctomycetes bacterium]|nr:FecR domain-containing protein [Planctomycetota bacterium]